MRANWIITIAIASMAMTAVADNLPPADYVVTIENNELTVADMSGYDEEGSVHLQRMPENLDAMRRLALGFMLELEEHYQFHAMFTIIIDEYPSPREYKAFIKRFNPDDTTNERTQQ